MYGSNDRLAGLCDRQTLILNRIQGLETDVCHQKSGCTLLTRTQDFQRDKLRQVRDLEGPSAINLDYQGRAHADRTYVIFHETRAMQDVCSTEDRLGDTLRNKGIPHRFVRVPADYYE